MEKHNVQAASVITSLLSTWLQHLCYFIIVSIYSFICRCVYARKKIIRLHKKGSEAIGAEISDPSFIKHEASFWHQNFLLWADFSCVILRLGKISRQQQKIFFVCLFPEREEKLQGVLGDSQNQWEWDTNIALSCPPVASAGTALWHSHCSVVCCCFDSKVWKYPVSVDIFHVPKTFLRTGVVLGTAAVIFFFFSCDTDRRCVCVCQQNICICVMLLVTTSVKSEVEKQQLNCLVEIHFSKVSPCPVVYVPHL